MSEPSLTIRYVSENGHIATVWRASTTRADVSVMVLVEDLLNDLDAEGKDRTIESL